MNTASASETTPASDAFALRVTSAMECVMNGRPLNRVLADAGWEWATFRDGNGSFPAYRSGADAEWVDHVAAHAAATSIRAARFARPE